MQIGGNHYTILDYETWDFVNDFNIDFFLGNVIKYLSRYKNKNGDEDLKKALSYCEKILNDNINTMYIDVNSRLVKLYLSQFDDVTQNYLILALTKRFFELVDLLK